MVPQPVKLWMAKRLLGLSSGLNRAGVKILKPSDLLGSFDLTEFKSLQSYLEAGYKKVWASWKACDLVANIVVSTPHTLNRVGSSTPAVVPDLTRLLTYPNEHQTFGDLLYQTACYLKWVGNAYWLKSESTLGGNRPKELFSLKPTKMRVLTDSSGELVGYRYWRSSGKFVDFDVEDVLHFKRPHPENDYYGIGDVEAGQELFKDILNRVEFQNAFWKNGGAPSGIISLQEGATSDQESWEKQMREMDDKFVGKKNAGKFVWLAGKWKFERIGLTGSEMQDLERLMLNTKQIFQLHGVPLSVAGIENAANYATAEVDEMNFRQNTVAPVVKIIQDTIQTDLVAGYGQNLEIRFNLSGLINVQRIMRDFGPLFDRGGMSINELREKAGLPRLSNPIFDQHYITAAYTPLDLAGIADQGATDRQAQRMIDLFLSKNPNLVEVQKAIEV